jgi:predicted histone-like DNA-binding protein
MAVQVIAFPVAARQNTNDDSTAYGKWFLVPFWPETLNLRGLIERVAFDQSVYSRDIVEGVIQKLTTVMVELLKSGQPVKWDGLGTFTPNINSKGVNSTSKVSVDQIQGVKINFIPENSKGEQLTSKAFKDLCTFEVLGKLITTKETHTSASGKTYNTYSRILQPLDYVAPQP